MTSLGTPLTGLEALTPRLLLCGAEDGRDRGGDLLGLERGLGLGLGLGLGIVGLEGGEIRGPGLSSQRGKQGLGPPILG